MRTTVRLDDELLLQAKALAARSGRTLTKVIEDALREALAGRPSAAGSSSTSAVRLPTDDGDGHGGGLQAGVDLDDSAALIELMEQDDPA